MKNTANSMQRRTPPTAKTVTDVFASSPAADERVHLTVRVSRDLRQQLNIVAAQQQRTLTEIVIEALTNHLDGRA